MRRILAVVLVSVAASRASAQPTAPAEATAVKSYAPKNDEPNPYLPGVSWGKLPDGRRWGATAGVDVAPDGTIWAYDRCGGNQNGCAASQLHPILHFDTSGNLLTAFGGGLFNFPHGIHVDKDGNVWVTDHGMTPANNKGQTVYKFSPDGKVLLILGKPGVAGTGPDTFNQPSDVLVAPNGDIFVADGHAGVQNARIVKFDKTGRFLKQWGSIGSGEANLNGPHALAMDSRGRLFVGDRSNNRVQVFDQEGTLLASWKQFGRPSGLFIDRDDMLYVTDSESRGDNGPTGYGFNPGVTRGFRIGSVKDGKVVAFVPDPSPAGISSFSEGVAIDRTGAIYGAEVAPRDMKKYLKAPPAQTTIAASGGPITITALMHASVQVEYAGRVLQIDPSMGDAARMKPADLTLVTDVHEDHMNPSRIAQARKPGTPVVAPEAVRREGGQDIGAPIEVLANGQTRTIAGVAITAVPMYNIKNEMSPGNPFHRKGRGNGYVVALGGKRLYFAGDTECVPEIRALRHIDVAFLPMNLPFTMPPSEAADCAKAFKPSVVIPYHFQGQKPEEFASALAGSGVEVRMLNWYPAIYRPEVIAVDRPGQLVNIGGRAIHMHCTGSGLPTVVLDGGSPSFALDWSLVQPDIAKSNRVCSYDRAGWGWSDPSGKPDTPEAAAADLHAALQAAGEQPPYVFVAHAVGAFVARAFHLQHADETAGFVLIDAAHEDAPFVPVGGKTEPLWNVSADDLRAIVSRIFPPGATPPPPPPAPDADQPPYNRLSPPIMITRGTFMARAFRNMSQTGDVILTSMLSQRETLVRLHELSGAAAPPFGRRPLIVLSPEYPETPDGKAFTPKLLKLSSTAVERAVPRSGSAVQLFEPPVVVRAVQDVVSAIKSGANIR